MNLFDQKVSASASQWLSIDHICPSKLEDWKKEARSSGVLPDLPKLSAPADNLQKMKATIAYRSLINEIRNLVEPLIEISSTPMLYLFTDKNGIVLDYFGSSEIMDGLHRINLRAGASFHLTEAGINAISLSMLQKDRVYLRGEKHCLRMFHGWTCICSPVRQNGQIVGYIDFSFSVRESCSHAMILLSRTVAELEQRMQSREARNEQLERYMDDLKLAPREKEVAKLWLENRSVLYIASKFNITEGTVRNVIKKVYRKVGVQDKGDFYRKLLAKSSG